MLGLLSHEPHFSLLREEVLFGREKKKIASVENTTFFLMHLSLFREYLDLEFSALKNNLKFSYDLEKIIDDFILMSFFVGNDFLPHLPGLHINEGALALMFNLYKALLPELDGYLNENGVLVLPRVQKMISGLANFEREQFEEQIGDIEWLDGKKNASKPGKKGPASKG
jgi:5'-3' exoribonuclease 1